MAFCKEVCPWAIRQAKQWSTWRGMAIGIGAVAVTINPEAGAAIALAMAKVVAIIDIMKDDSK